MKDLTDWRFELDVEGVAWLWADRDGQSMNSLSAHMLNELTEVVDEIEQVKPVALVIASGKSSGFIAGADVREFDTVDDVADATDRIRGVHRLFDRIESVPFPTIAAIRGACLGGGLELALACGYRIACDEPDTRFGFPEVKLGIFPGFGGTARSVHKLGGRHAMELMLTGRLLRARQAKTLGLVDQLVRPHKSLRWAARAAALAGRASGPPGVLARIENSAPVRPILGHVMARRLQTKASRKHYPAPWELLDLWRRSGGDRQALLKGEAERVARLLVGQTSVNLRRVFRLMERLKTLGRAPEGHDPFIANRVHVVGAGVMGGDIAAWCAYRGMEVTLQDREIGLIEPALGRARKLFSRLRDPAAISAAQGRLIADPNGRGVNRADVVVEAIVENLEAKCDLLRNLEPKLGPRTLLATNTSAIPLESLGMALSSPSRLIGLHFFNPVAQMPLVEVVKGSDTAPEHVSRGCQFTTRIDKLPLPVESAPGFLVNRVLGSYLLEAMAAVEEGVPIDALDEAARAFGMPMGPVELADTVGLDICLGVLGEQHGGRAKSARKRLDAMVAAGNLGKKSGRGFYTWTDGKPRRSTVPEDGIAALQRRLMNAYLKECESALEDGIVEDADLLDAGMIFGTGFAPFRGGPLNFASQNRPQWAASAT